jgi:hypothetical protein
VDSEKKATPEDGLMYFLLVAVLLKTIEMIAIRFDAHDHV